MRCSYIRFTVTIFKDGGVHVLHCYRVMLGKGTFSHKWVLLKNLCQNVCYVLVLVYGLRKKKSPVIPVALITTIY